MSHSHSPPGGWRGDSHLSDGQGPDTPGVDLTGGLYDAGGEVGGREAWVGREQRVMVGGLFM
jgi:hypothetical protein